MFAGKKSAQIREILISESAWEEMTCLFAPSLAMPSGSEEPQRDPALKRKAWLAVFLVSALFWVVVALLAWKYWG